MNILYKVEDAVFQAVSLICVKLWLWFGISKNMQSGLCCVVLAYDIIAKNMLSHSLFLMLLGTLSLACITFICLDALNEGTFSRGVDRTFSFYLLIWLDLISFSIGLEWFYYVLLCIAHIDFPPRKPLGRLSFSGA